MLRWHHKIMRIYLWLLIQWTICNFITKKETLLIKEMATWSVVDYDHNIFRDRIVPGFKQTFTKSGSFDLPRFTKLPKVTHTFDSRIARPECTHKIVYQGQCISSWAISIANSLSWVQTRKYLCLLLLGDTNKQKWSCCCCFLCRLRYTVKKQQVNMFKWESWI